MRTKITLGSSGTIDLYDEVPIPLNFTIGDIRKPETRQGSYSKTITIPGSKANDMLFAHIFEIDGDCRFNPNIKTPCVIYTDEIKQLSGYLRMIKIKRNDLNKIEYECSIIGNIANMFTVLGDAELSALSMAEFNHNYTKANQIASWSSTPGSGYVYPMIDYGFTNTLTYDVTNLYPAIYVKQYIDKIFEYAGFTYSSSFFNSSFFKRLIIPLNSNLLKLSDTQITPRLFEADISSSGTVALSSTAGVPATSIVPFNHETSDPSNQFNTGSYRFVSAYSGSFNFDTSFTYQLNTSFAFAPFGWVSIVKYSAGYYTTLASNNLSFFGGISDTAHTASISASNVDLLPGDEVFVQLDIYTTGTGTPNINIGSGSFKNSINNVGIFEGDAVDMTLAMPQKIKMKEFFTSIIKMFNLYLTMDGDIENKYIIETRNDFYNSGKIKDWTAKRDLSKDLEILPMGELDARKYSFTYTDDKDYYNEFYKKTWNRTYGDQIVDVTNEFINGSNENKVIFSPTPLVNNGSTDRTIPAIFSTDSTGNIVPKQSNIRILYYGGLLSTYYPWTYTGTLSGTSTESQYPYAGHLDSVSSPTIDLSFGVPNEVYYTALAYTNNNIYNAYHRQFIEEITDKDSKIVTGYFYLTPLDILLLDFRDKFFFDNAYFRLNKIIDYNPVTPELTKCEFIKIKEGVPFVADNRLVHGGVSSMFDNGDPTPLGGTGSGKPYVSGSGIKAPGNFVSNTAIGYVVFGDRNSVGEGCKNVSILNSSGCTVLSNIKGVTLINSSGVTVSESDVVYINNVKMSTGSYTESVFNMSQSGVDAPVPSVFSNTLPGTITWSYTSTGTYVGTLKGAFTSKKTFLLTRSVLPSGIVTIERLTDNTIQVTSKNLSGVLTDSLLTDVSFMIRVYQ